MVAAIELLQTYRGVLGQVHRVVFTGEQQFEAFANVRFVVYHQNAAAFRRAHAVGRESLVWKTHLCWL